MPYFPAPQPPPLIIGDDAACLPGVITLTLTALEVYLFGFELSVATTFSGVKYRTGTVATGSADAGIYSFAGTLLANIGGLVNVASTNVSQAFSGGNLTLQPGQYFLAWATQNATDTYGGISPPNIGATPMSRWRAATNAATVPVSVVVLPATTGGYGLITTASKLPAPSLTVVGGLV